jgi:iron complex outermembrane receptor protein
MYRSTHKFSLMALAIASALGVSDYTNAQMLEEVVVTARKRAESLQDVPMAVSAFDAGQLQDAQIDTIEDLERMTPNITLTETSGLQAGSLAVFVRGIGNDPGFDQGVGIYVDDVYMNRTGGNLLEVYDVARIEVLKGPQGNLYGRNTIGGAIKYISRDPTDEFMGDVELKYGEFDLTQLKLGVSGPLIGDTLMGGFGASIKTRDGIQENTLNGDEYWDVDAKDYRGSLIWNATDALRIKLAGDYSKDESAPRIPNRVGADEGFLNQLSDFVHGANVYLAPGTGVVDSPNDLSLPSDVDDVSTEFAEGFDQYEIEATTLALTITWDIDDNWSIKSVTAQRDIESVAPFDFDGSSQQFITTLNQNETTDTSQEFQLNYESEAFNAVMGLYYLDGDRENPGQTYQYPRMRGQLLQLKDEYRNDQELESKSVYGSFDWNVNEFWQLSVGGRYTEDEKTESQRATVTQTLYPYALSTAEVPEGVTPVFAVGAGGEEVAEMSPNFALWLTPFDRVTIQSFPENTDSKDDWSEFTPSARITWFAADDLMFYTGYSSGFKSGGFKRTGAVSTSYDPETVDTYSLGMKSTLLDGSLRLNAEAFFNDYQDKQLATIGVVDGELEETVDNVGELETSGVELELTWLPAIEGLLFGLNVGYLDTEVKSFEQAAEDGGVIDVADDTAIGFSPEWTVQGKVSYDFDLFDWGNLMLGADVSYRSESYTNSPIDLTNPTSELQVQEEHAIWNAIAAFRSADQRWRVAVEGKNLEDKRVLTNTFDLTLFQSAGYNMPRTWAVSIGYDF